MYFIEESETKLTKAEKKILESVLNSIYSGPVHVQSRQLRSAKNLVKKGYLKRDNKFCYSGEYYTRSTEIEILHRYAYGKQVRVSPLGNKTE